MERRRFRATCRLQLHAGFSLSDARALIPYLDRLGISHLYLSPVLQARPGSTHGYDVADSSHLNPEIGADDDWRALVRDLHARGMGILLDIVPNHMGVGSDNPYWDDVLTHGQAAHYARWFDIDWEPPQRGLRNRVLVPVLGDELRAVIDRHEITPEWVGDRIRLRYFDHSFPIDPATAPRLLAFVLDALPTEEREAATVRRAVAAFERMPGRTPLAPERQVERYRLAEEGWTTLSAERETRGVLRDAIDRAMREFATGPGGAQRMLTFLDAQAYRLAFWRRAATEINYRRFFEINELAALRMEDPTVFGERHRLLFEWIRDGLIDGLRIDHVDGLFDPAAYLERLRDSVEERVPGGAARPFPILVEKILSPGERMPEDWAVDGTTGYEFLNDLESLFVDPAGARTIEAGYRRLVRIRSPQVTFHEVAHRGKVAVLRGALRADVARLSAMLSRLARADAAAATAPRAEATEAVVQLIAALPVYRTYLTEHDGTLAEQDRVWVERALAEARTRGVVPEPLLSHAANLFLRHGEPEDADRRALRMRFVMRFQQTSSPATAKGVEDTALYRYVPLASLNEVGGEPSRELDDAVATLHRANAERLRRWRGNLLAVSTHDTKRSADVRARLDVLSEVPDRWLRDVARWRREAARHRTRVRGRLAPDASTEYLVLQNLVGIWPVDDRSPFPAGAELDALHDRLSAYALKSAREAKAQTSWTDPVPEWEEALERYVAGLFEGGARSAILQGVASLAGDLAPSGIWNALARQMVQYTAPGVPDLYQGDELWNFALVDPDNRRPVDWDARTAALDELERSVAGGPDGDAPDRELERELTVGAADGRAKLHVTRVTLAARRRWPSLFSDGRYLPLEATGPAARHVFAFARVDGARASGLPSTAVVVVPRLSHTLTGGRTPPAGAEAWGETSISLPDTISGPFVALCGGGGAALATSDARTLRVGEVLDSFPVALLVARPS